MTKTLNQFLEGYLKVKSSDEQKFIDKHVAVANPDRNGNGDDVFKGAKVKTINRRKERKGYDAGDDAKVYESVEHETKTHKIESDRMGHYTITHKPTNKSVYLQGDDAHDFEKDLSKAKTHKHVDNMASEYHHVMEEAELEEKAPPGAKYERMVKGIKKGYAKDGLTAREKAISYATAWKAKKANEEAELDEMRKDPETPAFDPARAGPGASGNAITKKRMSKTSANLFNKVMDKHTKYSKANEEKLPDPSTWKQHHREGDWSMHVHPDWGLEVRNKGKKVAHIEAHTRGSNGGYWVGNGSEFAATGKDVYDHYKSKKNVKEEAEQIDETSKEKATEYTKAAYNSLDRNNRKIGTHEWEKRSVDAGMRIPGRNRDGGPYNDDRTLTYSPDDIKGINKKIGKRLGGLNRAHKIIHKEETLVDILSGLKESHIRTMVEVYESLNEENQAKFVATCKKDGGIDAMLNFAIKNRGE